VKAAHKGLYDHFCLLLSNTSRVARAHAPALRREESSTSAAGHLSLANSNFTPPLAIEIAHGNVFSIGSY
jgi:hypothetical protein